jgi:NADH-quinone oxidoreductase subunit M
MEFEYDLALMSLVIFVPTIFALVLCIPGLFESSVMRRLFGDRDNGMRWVSLLGTAVTLVLSICMFISFYLMLDVHHQVGDHPNSENLLTARAEKATVKNIEGQSEGLSHSDWVARRPWIPRFNIEYFLGIDGISMPLVLLTTALSFLAMLASWNIERYVRGYCILFLILETGMIGTFLALDFFLFYIFWEVMLLPMYFLIGVWGGPRREYAAIKFFLFTLLGSVFILIALLGFYFTDVRDIIDPEAIKDMALQLKRYHPELTSDQAAWQAELRLAKWAEDHKNTFDIVRLQQVGKAASDIISDKKGNLLAASREELAKVKDQIKPAQTDQGKTKGKKEESVLTDKSSYLQWKAGILPQRIERLEKQSFFTQSFQWIMFLLLFVGFAIKVPVFPFHTWLPDAHVEAPTPISMILAGVLLKMGGYGIIRIAYPICPWAAENLAYWICLFGIINIVYGAFAAMAQTDFKKLVAYSSISHMGYVILGIAVWSATGKEYWSWAMNGAMFQMIAHGISSAGMFFLVGVIYDRVHHRNLDNFRGLLEPMPLYGGISAIIFFAAMGLPGLCGFVGEFMVVLGTWNFQPPELPYFGKVLSVLAALTVVLTAGYILWTLQRVYLGQNPAYKGLPDINFRELLCVLPLLIFAIALGVAPGLLLSWMEPSVSGLIDTLARLGP